MMEDTVSQTKRFLKDFINERTSATEEYVQFGIIGNYSLKPPDVEGEVTDWVLHHLEQRKCPYHLAIFLAKEVSQQLSASAHQNASQLNEDNMPEDFNFQSAASLHSEAMHNLHQLCCRVLDNPNQIDMSDMTKQLPYAVSVFAIRNKRRKMEDRHIILHDLNAVCNLQNAPPHSYYAVFDGHAGVDTANFAAAHLHTNIVEHPAFLTDTVTAIKEAFKKTDDQYFERAKREINKSGCTVVSALLREKTLYLAWLGDSQALLVKQGTPITIMNPHKPEREDEKERIEKLGGFVAHMGTWRVNGTLAVSRALGDPEHKPCVSSEPDVNVISLDGTEDFLILACDGLWDELTPSDVTFLLYKHLADNPLSNPQESIAEKLVLQSKIQGSEDNITTVVIFLRDVPSLINEAPKYASVLQRSDLLPMDSMQALNGKTESYLPPYRADVSLGCVNPFSDFVSPFTDSSSILPDSTKNNYSPQRPQSLQNVTGFQSLNISYAECSSNYIATEDNLKYGLASGLAPEATALSELPTPPIDDVEALQHFVEFPLEEQFQQLESHLQARGFQGVSFGENMQSVSNNPFLSESENQQSDHQISQTSLLETKYDCITEQLLHTSDIQTPFDSSTVQFEPEIASKESLLDLTPDEAVNIASGIVSSTIETAVKQVADSSTSELPNLCSPQKLNPYAEPFVMINFSPVAESEAKNCTSLNLESSTAIVSEKSNTKDELQMELPPNYDDLLSNEIAVTEEHGKNATNLSLDSSTTVVCEQRKTEDELQMELPPNYDLLSNEMNVTQDNNVLLSSEMNITQDNVLLSNEMNITSDVFLSNEMNISQDQSSCLLLDDNQQSKNETTLDDTSSMAITPQSTPVLDTVSPFNKNECSKLLENASVHTSDAFQPDPFDSGLKLKSETEPFLKETQSATEHCKLENETVCDLAQLTEGTIIPTQNLHNEVLNQSIAQGNETPCNFAQGSETTLPTENLQNESKQDFLAQENKTLCNLAQQGADIVLPTENVQNKETVTDDAQCSDVNALVCLNINPEVEHQVPAIGNPFASESGTNESQLTGSNIESQLVASTLESNGKELSNAPDDVPKQVITGDSLLPKEVQEELLKATEVPAPLEPVAAIAVDLQAIPDGVPEAEGVTEDVDSDSEKDGGWSYVKATNTAESKAVADPKTDTKLKKTADKKTPVSQMKPKRDLTKPKDTSSKIKTATTTDKTRKPPIDKKVSDPKDKPTMPMKSTLHSTAVKQTTTGKITKPLSSTTKTLPSKTESSSTASRGAASGTYRTPRPTVAKTQISTAKTLSKPSVPLSQTKQVPQKSSISTNVGPSKPLSRPTSAIASRPKEPLSGPSNKSNGTSSTQKLQNRPASAPVTSRTSPALITNKTTSSTRAATLGTKTNTAIGSTEAKSKTTTSTFKKPLQPARRPDVKEAKDSANKEILAGKSVSTVTQVRKIPLTSNNPKTSTPLKKVISNSSSKSLPSSQSRIGKSNTTSTRVTNLKDATKSTVVPKATKSSSKPDKSVKETTNTDLNIMSNKHLPSAPKCDQNKSLQADTPSSEPEEKFLSEANTRETDTEKQNYTSCVADGSSSNEIMVATSLDKELTEICDSAISVDESGSNSTL